MNPGRFFALDIKNPYVRIFAPLGLIQGIIAYAILMPSSRDFWALMFERGGYHGGFLLPGLIWAGLAFFVSYQPETWRRAAIAAAIFGACHSALWLLAFPGTETAATMRWWIAPWYVCSSIFGYAALPFVQIYAATGERRFPYADLYGHGWNNGQIVASSYILTGLFFGVVFLAAGLLNVLKVKIFLTLLEQAWFSIPAYFTVKAIGYAIARENTGMVVALRRLCLGFCSFLAPILAAFAIIFAVVLPFAGLEPIWHTRIATPIFLGFAITSILFFNAIFQDGASEQYFSRLNGKLQQAALALLPIFGLLAGYSTWLRIDQYGLTPDRYYALLLGAIVTAYGAIYAVAALRPLQATAIIQHGNVAMALGLILLALGVHLPGIDAANLSAASQYRLIASGKIAPENAGLWELRKEMGAPGAHAFARLKDMKNHPQQEALTKAIERAERQTHRYESQQAASNKELRDVRSYMIVKSDHDIPARVIDLMIERGNHFWLDNCKTLRHGGNKCILIAADLDHDGQEEFVSVNDNNGQAFLYVYDKETKSWKSALHRGLIFFKGSWQSQRNYLTPEMPIRTQRPRYDDIVIGDKMTIGFAAEGVEPESSKSLPPEDESEDIEE